MGFDDNLFESDVLEQLKETLKCAVGYHEDWDNIDKMENEHCYKGYSFIYKILYQYHYVMFQGVNGNSIKDDELTMRRLQLYTRRDTLQMYVDKFGGGITRKHQWDYDVRMKIMDLSVQCDKDIKALLHEKKSKI